ncbi:MAG TPA: TROVE domain-containing protein [Mycobacteriales bacterium]|nr:TROVE domain-containing protein [Mycobacteriales bacterium]
MSKYNRVLAVLSGRRSPVSGSGPTGRTHEGAPGWARDAKSELFLLAVTSLAGESSFYESAAERDARVARLAGRVAVDDVEWLTRLVRWVRDEAHLRSVAVVIAAEGVAARLAAGEHGGNRALVGAALRRPDEPGELVAYWFARHGRALPKPVKRGTADAVRSLYSERALAKYDTDAAAVRFGDVLELTHPAPVAPWQGDLFAHAISRRHARAGELPATLPVLRARAELLAVPAEQRRDVLLADDGLDRLRAAGMTWESVAGWLGGPLDAAVWERLVGVMGYMALLRNLRNLDRAGVSDVVAATVSATLADPEQVARSRQLPLRFLSAYREAPSLRWAPALEAALQLSLRNVPALAGRTLVLVDRSVSMFGPLSARSKVTRADAAALFGAAVAARARSADLVEFGTSSREIRPRQAESLLRTVERFGHLGGTNTAEAVRRHYRGHDRVLIVTDEQAWAGWHGQDPTAAVPAGVPVYTWNVAGYRYGHGPSGTGNRHTFGGLSDGAFVAVPLLERGRDAGWPF